MKNTIFCLALLAVLPGLPAIAQAPQTVNAAPQAQPVEDFKPSSLNQPGKQYPQVNSERRVRARVVAPQAQSVAARFLGGARYPLTKGDDGAWVGVTRPQDEGFHYYQLVIDGAEVPDPGSSVFLRRAAAGAAASKSPPRTRTSMPSRTCRTASCGRPSTIPRAPTPLSAASFTPRRIMKRIRPSVIRCCICNTAAGKMKPAGAARATPA